MIVNIIVSFEVGLTEDNISLLNIFGERGWNLLSKDVKQNIDTQLNYAPRYYIFSKEFIDETSRDADEIYIQFGEDYIFDKESFKTKIDNLSDVEDGTFIRPTSIIGLITITLPNGISEDNASIFNTYGSNGWELKIIDSDQLEISSLVYSSKNYIMSKIFDSQDDLDADSIYTTFGENYIFNKKDYDLKVASL